MTAREQRGQQIAQSTDLQHNGDLWYVPSQSGRGRYKVFMNPKGPRCTCPDFENRGQKCKHIYAVEHTIQWQENEDGTTTVTETVKVTYSQNWTAYNKAQTTEKREFMALLRRLCDHIEEPEQYMGRPRLSLTDMAFSAAFKVYCGTSGRRFMTDLNAAYESGHLSECPHYNSLSRYLRKPELSDVLHALIARSSLPLKTIERDFAVDSSGFGTRKYINWYQTRYQGRGNDEHDWLKVHLMSGVTTNVVTAVEIGARHAHDSMMFPRLVETTSRHFQMREISADKAYLSHKNMELAERHGATPYIPFKKDTVMRDDGDIWSKMYHLYAFNQEEFLAHYHKRSNVETTFHMIKGKFGDFVRAKDESGQINEVLCKVLCHNICCLIQSMNEFGIDVDLN